MLCQRCGIKDAVHDICRETVLNVTHVCSDCLTPEDLEGLAPEPPKMEKEQNYE